MGKKVGEIFAGCPFFPPYQDSQTLVATYTALFAKFPTCCSSSSKRRSDSAGSSSLSVSALTQSSNENPYAASLRASYSRANEAARHECDRWELD
jgi:hypothetical protein